jgi:aspartate carbamoyltransferase regulatory subunit
MMMKMICPERSMDGIMDGTLIEKRSTRLMEFIHGFLDQPFAFCVAKLE